MNEINDKHAQLQQLRAQVEQLEQQLNTVESSLQWPPRGFYAAYYATTGFLLGAFGAAASLVLNVVGAPLAGKTPLELIRVYLTFPLGQKALELTGTGKDVFAIPDGVILALGCCLYLGTGMVLGVPFYVALVRLSENRPLHIRLGIASVLALLLWLFNFYAILSWLQPALFGDNWITDPKILPPWVAAFTHLVFGWTLAILYPLGRFVPYQREGSQQSIWKEPAM